MRGVSANCTVVWFVLGIGVDDTSSVFDKAVRCDGTVRRRRTLAFTAGSSQHGIARRASVASNCVTAAYRVSPSTTYAERYTPHSVGEIGPVYLMTILAKHGPRVSPS